MLLQCKEESITASSIYAALSNTSRGGCDTCTTRSARFLVARTLLCTPPLTKAEAEAEAEVVEGAGHCEGVEHGSDSGMAMAVVDGTVVGIGVAVDGAMDGEVWQVEVAALEVRSRRLLRMTERLAVAGVDLVACRDGVVGVVVEDVEVVAERIDVEADCAVAVGQEAEIEMDAGDCEAGRMLLGSERVEVLQQSAASASATRLRKQGRVAVAQWKDAVWIMQPVSCLQRRVAMFADGSHGLRRDWAYDYCYC